MQSSPVHRSLVQSSVVQSNVVQCSMGYGGSSQFLRDEVQGQIGSVGYRGFGDLFPASAESTRGQGEGEEEEEKRGVMVWSIQGTA